MRPDIIPGAVFPDYELPDHTAKHRKLSELQGQHPTVLILSRGSFCPKDRRQHEGLLQLHRELEVGYCRLVTISTDNITETSEFRTGVGAHWPFLSDSARKIQKDLDIAEYTDPGHNPMIPHTIVLEPGLVIYKVYNGYWFFGRPTVEDLRQDLRAVTKKCRPDWDITTPELKAAWQQGRKELFYPYGKTYIQTLGEQDWELPGQVRFVMFALHNVLKLYAQRPALGPLTLTVPPGRTTVLIGPSGCGKSTFLRLLIGLVGPDAGEVTFDGKPVAPATVRAVRLRAGYVIQDGGLFPHLTARGNVTLMARHLGRDRRAIAARVAELTDLTRFPADGLDRYPHELSGGQRQRVGLMRALMLNPDALLLDEPLGSLDPLVRADLQAELRDIFRRLVKTVVLVTHDLAEAAFFADRVVLLRAGQVVQEGSPADLWHHPADAFVTQFVQAQRGPEVPA